MQTEQSQGRAQPPVAAPARRVLVVDDSPLQRRVLELLLRRWGFDVVCADGGAAALTLCAERPPELVISDWMMPGMDGLEFCRAFRALDRSDYGYFILLTSKDEKAHVAQGLDSGADDFLTKPVNPVELRARLNAGERILTMQRELREKNVQIAEALAELQKVYDSIDSDLVEARKLQQSLVRERSHDFGRAQVALTLSPAGRVGGDLVGFFPAGPSHAGLFAIDVSGHGISSALMTARLAGHLSSAVPDQNVALTRGKGGEYTALPPVEVAARMNRLMQQEMEVEHYFTLLLAICDLDRGEVRLVQAGHPHPMLQRADGRIERVGQGGLPIGLIADAGYEEVVVQLAPGDRLLIMSDGMIECPSADGMVGEDGLERMLDGLRGLRGQGLLETLIWQLGEVNPGRDFPDDISAILLEFGG
ncbi:PP2C family protein-serine/threonine phosphatase [Pseudooceanicola sp. LIPI14-2-Ac024]|uniref:PP2C family protein-serine/threonine phosphatase n=1 Tax=Pseudooceanicola sp. LIPI14-2-Ac024 TaxID=3344875 RepID=UPI0035CF62FF